MKYDCVIFDLDGTLLDTLEDLQGSVNFALREHGMPERSLSEIRTFVGNGVRNLVKRSAASETSEEKTDSILADFRRHYAIHSKDKTKPYEGVIGLLTELKGKGISTAVVSNKVNSAVRELVGEYFGDLIDVAIGELEGIKRKPAPDTVNLAIERSGCKNPVYIGDSEVDVQTAKNAGLDGVFVTWGFRSEEELRAAGAEVTVHTADELSEVLK